MKKNQIFLILISLALFYSCATYNTHSIIDYSLNRDDKNNELYYMLPKKDYAIVVQYDVVKFKRNKFLKVIDEKSFELLIQDIQPFNFYKKDITSTIVKKVEMKPIVIPDTNHIYAIELMRKNNIFIDKKFMFDFNEKAALSKSTIESNNKIPSYAMGLAKTAIQLYTGSFSATDLAILDSVHAEIKESKIALKKLVSSILELRKQRKNLYKNPATCKCTNIALHLKYLDNQEEKLLKQLRGSKESKNHTKEILYTPKEGTNSLFFVTNSGINGDGSKKSEYIINLQLLNKSSTFSNYLNEKNQKVQASNKGIYYRFPAMGRMTIIQQNYTYENEEADTAALEIINTTQLIPQLGNIAFLPTRVGLFNNKYTYALHPETGALLKFDAQGKEIDSGQLSSYFDDISTYGGKLKKEEDEFEDEENELKHLKNQLELLQIRRQVDSLSNKD